MESSFPPNDSNERLMDKDDNDGYASRRSSYKIEERRTFKSINRTEWVTIVVLCYVNLINYMDRYTMAGIMLDIKNHFKFGDDIAGLLQTVFVISYMLFAPLFGYLGDRYSRKAIMAFGVSLWSLTTLLGSFMDTTFSFILLRAFVGIGEASYSTIAPTIISDLFVQDLRAKVLALFYFAIPVGSGMGYIVGSETARAAGNWQWALRVTPIMGTIAVLAIIFGVNEPRRGESEGRSNLKPTSWGEDLKLLMKNRSFMLSTLGFMSVSFVAGALSWWGPDYIHRGVILQPGKDNAPLNDVAYKFGILTMVSGVIGVPLGPILASFLKKYDSRADPLICAFGLLASAPVLFFASLLPRKNTFWCFTLILIGEILLNLNWSIVASMLLYVVIPTRRSTAEAFQILASHMFGDAGSPYLVGVVADAISKSYGGGGNVNQTITMSENEISYYSLQYSLFMTVFVEFIGGLFFLLTSVYIIKDKLSAEREIRGIDETGEILVSKRGRKVDLSNLIHILKKDNNDRKMDEFFIGDTKEQLTYMYADETERHPSMI